ncbi:hypothetical protein KVR01_003273 [Diaporthe batatas]|uniref:uncharacterized protein n=1 Tax=Diaporthe batatas TaxID=748121 RepID=UPI001D05542F|nr:uncharacterized protein KVR01_003273 [Diaporthe batatas]KAG8167584.1 hypothetical protein KVR01_003273 [Diaporthe batatas]
MANRVRGRETVFRVAGIPPGATEGDAASIVDQDPYCLEQHTEMVATVTFETLPPQLATATNLPIKGEAEFRGEWILVELTFDITFLGFTPLNEVHCPRDEIIDCIVVSGLASHAYGSWKSRKDHFMWLRDDATWRKPNVRVMLYGYDTALVNSESFQTIENIGTELGATLSRVRRMLQQGKVDSRPRPIVFIAHSLGGLVVKQAICKMSSSKKENQRITASCIYGLIFFGVPNAGIRIEHWLPMVKGQPNEVLVRDLRPGSEYLLNLQRNFEAQFTYPKSKILSVFETMRTRTAKFEGGRWQITGPHEILVEEASATKPMDNAPESISLCTMQMNQNHADLPKFAHRHDLNYMNLVMELEGFWHNAIDDVRLRVEPDTITGPLTVSPGSKDNDDENVLGGSPFTRKGCDSSD